jgi:hypothetical protein
VHRQLDLWPHPQKAPQPPDIWQNLDQHLQARLIAALARLITKAAYPENLNQTGEKKHDQ